MKKILLSMVAAVCLSASAFAQAHSDRITLGVGLLYENGLDATLSWEHETKYHNAWEYFVNGYLKWDECASCGHICPDSFWKNYRTWGVGAAYKPCVVRGRNHYGNNAWEYFVNGYLKWDECASCGHICPDSFWKNYRTWGVGAAYKPCVVRGRNHYGNVRIGASVGSNTDKFLGGFHLGYEHNFALRKGWVLYVQAKCDLMVPDREDLFREGIVIGKVGCCMFKPSVT